ncbi:Hercynine oxygenase [Candidatus Magnetaquicoccaceae bacterium FCR-1]|uniref:Hercynine oxygenase n=1 Tax=Candidatus Magnetaquiglobus chichijimensis TaxID=3141448 RepID=A0ABQ0CCP0_9PROT
MNTPIRRGAPLLLLVLALSFGGCQWSEAFRGDSLSDAPPADSLRLTVTERLGTLETIPEVNVAWREPRSGITLIRIAGGCFAMGDDQGLPPERPAHTVCVDDYWLATHETTQAQWRAVMGSLPVQTIEQSDLPVENVSWNDVRRFIERLNGLGGGRFRLPTEAEWEFACRERGATKRHCGTDDDPTPFSWHAGIGGVLHPVGQRLPNRLGLHDMNGNVWEWVGDWYDESYYRSSPGSNPEGPDHGTAKVFRGGGLLSGGNLLKATHRASLWPDRGLSLMGFRLAGMPP